MPHVAKAAPARDPHLVRTTQQLRTSVMFPVLDVLGDPWILRVLYEIASGRGRFEVLVSTLALPRSTLAARLRLLLDSGCLVAEPYSDSPPRFDYRLTERGAAALGPVLLLRQWSQHFAAARADVRPLPAHRCGAPLIVDLACACGVSVDPRAIAVLAFPPGAAAPDLDDLVPAPAYRRTRRGVSLSAEALVSPTAEECVGDRWVSLVLGAMLFGLRRFRDFGFALGIAPNILSSRLGQLADAGLVARTTGGARAEYRLTARSVALYPAIVALHAWGERWLEPGWASRAGWSLLHRPCASWLAPAVVCASCRAPVDVADELAAAAR